MDTRFWGPSGWRLLHLIAADTLDDARREHTFQWFQLLPFVLPCKYCRASLQEYYDEQPLTIDMLKSPETFGRWLYDIHNRVNEKLRKQKLLKAPNPSWPTIRAHYQRLHRSLCDTSPLLGWDFMASVAYTTPACRYRPSPMPHAPSGPMSPETKNRYNLMTRDERIAKLRAWWNLLPSILPCAAWRRAWAGNPPLEKGRHAVNAWMWRLEESVCSKLQCPTPHDSLPALKEEMSAFESACASKTHRNAKTCRARRRTLRRKRTNAQFA